MGFKLKSYLPIGAEIISVDIFGYSSRSVPGMEIYGLGSKGRLIREKINFVTNNYMPMKKAMKKYVISIESSISEEKLKQYSSNLEFPLIILYWAMADIIPLKNISDCWATGGVSVDFEICSRSISEVINHVDSADLLKDKTLICQREDKPSHVFKVITWEDLISNQEKTGFPSKDLGISSPSTSTTVGATS